MNPDLLEEAFKKYPNTKVVLIVHLYGLSSDLDKILEICNKHNAILIEDAAESLGTYYKKNTLVPLVNTAYSVLTETK